VLSGGTLSGDPISLISGVHSSALVWGYAMMERSVITPVSPDILPAALAVTFDPAGAGNNAT
jgi:hypothetical protein